jgi:hypothetical protein
MPIRCFSIYCFIISLFFSGLAYAQDTSSLQSSSNSATAFYYKFIGENAHFYNGSEYIPYDVHIKGHPSFETELLEPAVINYDNLVYEGVNLNYDIVRDEVTTNRFERNFRIKLISEKIAYFSLLNHFFVRLVQDSTNKSVINTGFYERIYNGNDKVYIKHSKIIEEKVTDYAGDEQWFTQKDIYLVEKTGRFYPIQSKSMLFDLIKDRKKDVQKYLRKNKIKFRKDPRNAILRTIEYYDQIKN